MQIKVWKLYILIITHTFNIFCANQEPNSANANHKITQCIGILVFAYLGIRTQIQTINQNINLELQTLTRIH